MDSPLQPLRVRHLKQYTGMAPFYSLVVPQVDQTLSLFFLFFQTIIFLHGEMQEMEDLECLQIKDLVQRSALPCPDPYLVPFTTYLTSLVVAGTPLS